MIVKKRFIAPLAFAWTFAAAAMAGVAFSTGSDATPAIMLEDVQIGERGAQTRIAFICSAPCTLEKRADGYLLNSVEAAFDFDLGARSDKVSRVSAESRDGGALISVTARAAVDRSSVKSCTVGGRPAACLDIFFSEGVVAEKTQTARAVAKPSIREAAAEQPQRAPATVAAAVAKPAGLREAAPDRLSAFARLAPPERLAPPSAVLAKVQPIEQNIEVRKPLMRADTPLAAPVRADFAARVRAILHKEISPPFCNNAEATLQADAWALGAMVDVGLCAAARGDLAEADTLLARLLEFTPDNYEALVGRAIIAEQVNEKGVARKYYQDALNALPPIEESNRIVSAMASLQ